MTEGERLFPKNIGKLAIIPFKRVGQPGTRMPRNDINVIDTGMDGFAIRGDLQVKQAMPIVCLIDQIFGSSG